MYTSTEIIKNLSQRLLFKIKYLEFAKKECAKYKKMYETEDKFEVASSNYWRGVIATVEQDIEDVKDHLNQLMLSEKED